MTVIKHLDLDGLGYDKVVQVVTKQFIAKRRNHLPPSDVPDLFQEAQIAFMRAASRYDDTQASFETYVSRRVSGSLLDEHRKRCKLHRKTKATYQTVSLDPSLIAETIDPGGSVEDELLLDDIEPHLYRLEPRQHIAIRLAFLSDPTMTPLQIGQVLGWSEPSIRLSIATGIKKLREILRADQD
jgi:RNA polymerase sigma factor (sigma-70 family)